MIATTMILAEVATLALEEVEATTLAAEPEAAETTLEAAAAVATAEDLTAAAPTRDGTLPPVPVASTPRVPTNSAKTSTCVAGVAAAGAEGPLVKATSTDAL